MARSIALLAAILGFTGVALGAFGAHGLQATLQAYDRVGTFETAVQYQMYHALALIGVASLAARKPLFSLSAAALLFFGGTLVFSGSLYLLAIFDLQFLGPITPIGGILLLLGWLMLGIGGIRMGAAQ